SAHFLLARNADTRGDWDAQRKHLKAAVENNPDEPRYLLRYAVAHLKSDPARFRELALQSVDDRKGERCVEHLLRRGRAPLEVPPRARVVVGIVPSSPNAIRDPLLPPAVLQASATKRSRTSVSVAPSHFAL